jgi:ribokinase
MPSAEEVIKLTGHSDWSAAARGFAELGPALVVIKLGAEGCLIFDRTTQHEIRVPACPATVVDTTGAGDSFCGAFIAALLQDRGDIEAAARAAAVTASFAVEGYGVDPLWSLDRAQVLARLDRYRSERAIMGSHSID